MTLVYSEIAGRASSGPLVDDVGFATLGWLAATNPQRLTDYMNSRLVAAEQALPEGARIEISMTGWTLLGSSWAQRAAGQVQAAWEQGRLVDADTGRPVEPWPEYPDRIAWGDDATDTVTIRTVKAAIPLVIGWIVIALIAVVAVYQIWQWLRDSNWAVRAASDAAAAPGDPQPPVPGSIQPKDIPGWLLRNWPWVLLGGATLAAAPFIVRQVAHLREARNELDAAEHGEY
ncbi:MAG TPA: hypothetical protein VGK74_22250 [Symbiobacteriaceae bacterium]|jgi:hypothetical protein